MKRLFILLIGMVVLTGCKETKGVTESGKQHSLAGNYLVTNMEGKTLQDNAPTLQFSPSEKRVSGTTGCNRYFGTYAHEGNSLSISDLGSTEMACPQPQMDTEFVFVSVLRNTGSYSINKGVLTLYSKNDKSVLLTAKEDTAERN